LPFFLSPLRTFPFLKLGTRLDYSIFFLLNALVVETSLQFSFSVGVSSVFVLMIGGNLVTVFALL
jgi:hypothetical protein